MRQGQEGLTNIWLLTSYHCGPCSVIPWALGASVVSPERGGGWGLCTAVLIKLPVDAALRGVIPCHVWPALKSCAQNKL